MQRISKDLRTSLEETGAINHALTRGEIREKEIIDALRPHIPKRFEMGTGVVVNAGGEQSKQQDVIISDALAGTPFLGKGDIGVYPVEIVFATLQVRSRISVSLIAEPPRGVASDEAPALSPFPKTSRRMVRAVSLPGSCVRVPENSTFFAAYCDRRLSSGLSRRLSLGLTLCGEVQGRPAGETVCPRRGTIGRSEREPAGGSARPPPASWFSRVPGPGR
jgi:hypothetical protein